MAADEQWYELESIAFGQNGCRIKRLVHEDWQSFDGTIYGMIAVDAYRTNNTCYHPTSAQTQYLTDLQPLHWLDAANIQVSPVALRTVPPTAPVPRRRAQALCPPHQQNKATSLSRRLDTHSPRAQGKTTTAAPQKIIQKPRAAASSQPQRQPRRTCDGPPARTRNAHPTKATRRKPTVQLTLRELLNRPNATTGDPQTPNNYTKAMQPETPQMAAPDQTTDAHVDAQNERNTDPQEGNTQPVLQEGPSHPPHQTQAEVPVIQNQKAKYRNSQQHIPKQKASQKKKEHATNKKPCKTVPSAKGAWATIQDCLSHYRPKRKHGNPNSQSNLSWTHSTPTRQLLQAQKWS
eukprot:GHUV01029689.1.p1 GENE.GHUV01029689.1~~GHUV01029689.1.p1  ORF type:complete len:348 (+),score=44.83 GHUV01029689.1:505-1548(+)